MNERRQECDSHSSQMGENRVVKVARYEKLRWRRNVILICKQMAQYSHFRQLDALRCTLVENIFIINFTLIYIAPLRYYCSIFRNENFRNKNSLFYKTLDTIWFKSHLKCNDVTDWRKITLNTDLKLNYTCLVSCIPFPSGSIQDLVIFCLLHYTLLRNRKFFFYSFLITL